MARSHSSHAPSPIQRDGIAASAPDAPDRSSADLQEASPSLTSAKHPGSGEEGTGPARNTFDAPEPTGMRGAAGTLPSAD
jgi:hypothetical protein